MQEIFAKKYLIQEILNNGVLGNVLEISIVFIYQAREQNVFFFSEFVSRIAKFLDFHKLFIKSRKLKNRFSIIFVRVRHFKRDSLQKCKTTPVS